MTPGAFGRPVEDVLVDELLCAARASTPAAYQSGPFEILLWLAGRGDAPPSDWLAAQEAIDQLIESAIVRLYDPRHRCGAGAIFGIGHPRWLPLGQRQSAAAAYYGVGYDTYRKLRPDGLSPYRETIRELARSLLAGVDVDVGLAGREGFLALATARFIICAAAGVRGMNRLAIQLPAAALEEIEALALDERIDIAELLRISLLEHAAMGRRSSAETVHLAEGRG